MTATEDLSDSDNKLEADVYVASALANHERVNGRIVLACTNKVDSFLLTDAMIPTVIDRWEEETLDKALQRVWLCSHHCVPSVFLC